MLRLILFLQYFSFNSCLASMMSNILVKVHSSHTSGMYLTVSDKVNLRDEVIKISSIQTEPFSQIDMSTDNLKGLEIELVTMLAEGLQVHAEIKMYDNRSFIMEQLIDK